MGRKHCGKRRNCSLRATSPFPMVFSKDLYCKHVKTRAVWARVKCLIVDNNSRPKKGDTCTCHSAKNSFRVTCLCHTGCPLSYILNDIFLDWIKFKVFTDDKLNVAKMISTFDRVENMVGKGENAGYQHFLLFRQDFQNTHPQGC